MNMTGKITKTEWALLLLAAVFLVLVGSVYRRAMVTAEGTDYTITTQRQAEEAVTPEPMPLVDINTADARQLQTLKGIGPALAERIVAYREEHGPFTSVEELLLVSGIGEHTLEQFRDRVTAAGAAPVTAAGETEQ